MPSFRLHHLGELYIHFTVDFPDTLPESAFPLLEQALPARTAHTYQHEHVEETVCALTRLSFAFVQESDSPWCRFSVLLYSGRCGPVEASSRYGLGRGRGRRGSGWWPWCGLRSGAFSLYLLLPNSVFELTFHSLATNQS